MKKFRILVLAIGIGIPITLLLVSIIWSWFGAQSAHESFFSSSQLLYTLAFASPSLIFDTIPFILYFFWSKSKSKSQIIAAGVLLLTVVVLLRILSRTIENPVASFNFYSFIPLSVILIPLGFFIGRLYDKRSLE